MNILQVLPELNVGGVETGTVDLARHLVKLGHKAVVVSSGGELVKELLDCGALHYQLPVHEKSIVTMIRMVPRLAKIIEKENIDIVHARSRIPAWPAYFAARRTRRVFITTCHGYYRRHIFSYAMGWGKRVIVLSNAIARHMIDDFGVPYEKIRLVPRSVDLEKFKFISPRQRTNDVFNVGIIGRITPIKGHLVFIKAMAKVASQVPNLKVWVIGDAPASKEAYKEQLQILVKRLGLSQNTQFLGTQRDIPGILSQLDLLVLATTTQEAFGRVIIEAQAAGVPVVATQVGGVVDIIEDGKTGLLVPASDPIGMAEAVLKIYTDVEASAEMAQNAYKKVREKYTIELMVKNTLDIYHEALSNFKILIIKLSSLGDIILSTAAIRAIWEKFWSRYKISFLVGEESKDVLLCCPYIDELLVCDLKNKDKGLPGVLRVGRKLRRSGFDIVIDLQNNRKSHILARLSLALDRYGYGDRKFGFLLNCGVRDDGVLRDPITHQFQILRALDIELKNPHLELWPTEEDYSYIDELLKAEWLSPNQKIAGLHVSASPRWRTKNWPAKHMVQLCEEMAHRDIRIVLTGTQQDASEAQYLISEVKSTKPINLCGRTTVNQLAALIKRCSVYICADSAPMHIAASMDTSFIALFGPTDPRRHLPPAKKYAVLKKELPCSPCYKPACKTVKCMQQITPQEILEAMDKL